MSSFSSERPLDVSGTRVLFGIGTALPGSLLLSISCEGDVVGWWDAATGAVLIVCAVILGPGPRKVDTSGVSYAAWVSVAELSASKSSGARRLHQECRLRVL